MIFNTLSGGGTSIEEITAVGTSTDDYWLEVGEVKTKETDILAIVSEDVLFYNTKHTKMVLGYYPYLPNYIHFCGCDLYGTDTPTAYGKITNGILYVGGNSNLGISLYLGKKFYIIKK